MPPADYVVVGAGSAGYVLANRLSEDSSVRVLLLDARKGRRPNISIPAAFAKQFHTKLDWDLARSIPDTATERTTHDTASGVHRVGP